MVEINGYKYSDFDFTTFYKVSDLIYYDGPLLSHYINRDGDNFLFHWCDIDYHVNRWIGFRVSMVSIQEYIEKKYSLRELFEHHAEKLVYVIDLDDDLNVVSSIITEYENVPVAYKPASDSYYSFSYSPSEDLEDYYLGVSESGVLQAIFKNSERVGYGTLPMDILSSTLFHLNVINNGLGLAYYNEKNKNRPITSSGKRVAKFPKQEVLSQTQFEVAGAGPGSFKLFLRPLTSQKTIGSEKTETDNYFDFFMNFIQSSFQYEELLKIVSILPIDVVNHYEKLLKNIEVNKFDFQLRWNNPSSKQKNYIYIEQKKVGTALENINRLEYENSTELKLVGRFVELNLLSKHYIFIQDDGIEKIESRGFFDKLVQEGIILVQFNKTYEVTISRKELKEAGNKNPKVKDVLISFYLLSEGK